MATRLLMIGGWTDIYRKAKALGFDLTVVQRRQDIRSEDLGLIDQLLTAALSDRGIVPVVEAMHREMAFDAVVSFQELGVLNAAVIADRLGIAGNPLRPVLLTRDKCAMRRHLLEVGIPSIPFIEADSAAGVIDFGNEHGWPIILKPANGVGSIQVHKIGTPDEVHGIFEQILADPVFMEVTQRDFPTAGLIAEKFVVGCEISVEAVSWNGVHTVLGATDKLLMGESNFVEAGHTMPSALPAEMLARIDRLVVDFLTSIGHLHGPSHTEIIVSADGPVIVESHTRTGGDRIFEMAEYVYGIDMINATLQGFAGQFALQRCVQHGGAAIRFVEAGEGTVRAIAGIDEAASAEGVVRADIAIKVGAAIKPSRHSAERPGYILAVGATREAAINNAETAARRIAVELA